ncbi:hypothetical protein EPD60_03970 [Flaviaesturariibacter flavus]|uniref:Uncharacterized protein n=1 Tax=Flaviaesturariibacter flavus TaxID=2502780 RepID=A0A4R1BMM2_9BACT|nr:hypothetical protein [Flaviaesturariibacter flavus]TCJ18665.1 hypothetical protein EPD60_03970 [Flaviaesturariibacter flavus]
MKNTILTAAVLALGVAANAQTPTTTQTVPATNPVLDSSVVTAAPAKPKYKTQNSTADSISAKYKLLPMPGELTLEKKFPAVGSYQLSGAAEGSTPVTIALDSNSKGTIWVSGLPQGTFKAYLAKSPATYRIVSQKSQSGTQVPEGTLYFSPESNTLQIALGALYNSEDPIAIFPAAATVDAAVAATEPVTAEVKVKKVGTKGKTKAKNKVTFYTASKANTMNNTSSNAAFDQQLQQANKQ